MASFLGFVFFFLASYVTACDRCVHQSKAAYYNDDSQGLYRGACGYGNLTFEVSKGYFAAAVSSLFKQGAGCGACFQIRCKNENFCSTAGSTVVLTDKNDNNNLDFVLSQKAFSAMALKGKGQQLMKLGIVDIEYKRVPCGYQKQNLLVQVDETSQNPYYLAIKFLYQGGQTEIVAVDVAQVGSSNWGYMSRNHGAVWDSNRIPKGALQFRLVVTSGYDGKWVWAKSVLPDNWESGLIYDTGIQIDDIAKEGCPPNQCGDRPWK